MARPLPFWVAALVALPRSITTTRGSRGLSGASTSYGLQKIFTARGRSSSQLEMKSHPFLTQRPHPFSRNPLEQVTGVAKGAGGIDRRRQGSRDRLTLRKVPPRARFQHRRSLPATAVTASSVSRGKKTLPQPPAEQRLRLPERTQDELRRLSRGRPSRDLLVVRPDGPSLGSFLASGVSFSWNTWVPWPLLKPARPRSSGHSGHSFNRHPLSRDQGPFGTEKAEKRCCC